MLVPFPLPRAMRVCGKRAERAMPGGTVELLGFTSGEPGFDGAGRGGNAGRLGVGSERRARASEVCVLRGDIRAQ